MSARISVSVPRLAILALAIATVSRLLEAHLGFPRAVNWLHFPIVGLAFALQVMLAFLVAYVVLHASRVASFAAALRVAGSALLILGATYVALWSRGLHEFLYDQRNTGAFAHKFRIFSILAGHFDSPANWIFGVGPGHGVSRLGGWLLETYWSVLEPLGATRTGIAAEAWAANAREGPASSLFAPLFSWAGIFGDIGIAGLAAYGWLLWLVYRRSADDFSRLLVLAVVALGFCFDWLEQYNFMLYALAVLAERSLAGSGRPPLRLPAAQSIEP